MRHHGALGMYMLPEMAAANAALWAALRAALDIPGMEPALDPPQNALPGRLAPDLLFAQMCGYPLRTLYAGQYRMLATPLYDLPGCRLGADGVPTHCSFLIVPAASNVWTLAQLRGRRFAINGRDSNSGMNLPRRLFAPWAKGAPYFSEVLVSGGHVASMGLVAEGAADAAAIDCVTYGFVARYRPELTTRLRVIAETPASPAIPFITASATPPALARRLAALLTQPLPPPALAAALAGLSIRRLAPARPEAYDLVMAYEAESAALGYPVLV